MKAPTFLAVGWDKLLHKWDDPAAKTDGGGDEEEDFVPCEDIPPPGITVHRNDIMSCCFDLKTMLIFTGGVDGFIIGWNYETKFARHELHLSDPTCTSTNHIADSKSVDALVIMEEKRLLISMSADQWIRFWDIDNMTVNEVKPPVFKFNADHMNPVFLD